MNNLLRHLPHGAGLFASLLLLEVFLPRFSAYAEPPPEPPLIANTPDSFAWTIDVQRKKPRVVPSADPGQETTYKRLMDIDPLLMRETVEKAGKEWHREKFYDNQRKDNFWVCNGMVAFQFQHFPQDKVTAMPTNNIISPVKGGFGPDFPELDWIDAKYFVGTVSLAGQMCHFYRKQNAKPLGFRDELTPAPKTSLVSAWINAKTRLPVAIEDDEIVERYTYRAGPASIQPTGIFAEALGRAMKAAKAGDQ